MTSSAKTTYTAPLFQPGRNIGVAEIDWMAASGGAILPITTTDPIIGWIERIDTIPGAVHPTDAYDVTLSNEDGVDVAGGELANRSSAVAQMIMPKIGNAYGDVFVNQKLTFAASGNSVTNAVGTVKFYFRPHKQGTGR